MRVFDLLGPLPSGTTVLEASAGTGKTHALASLAVRFLAEGEVTMSSLMLITFSRMATQELRSRVRSRVLEAIAALRGSLTDPPRPAPADPVLAMLMDADRATVSARLARLETAAVDFDSATIATTHEFCQRMLFGLGILADQDPEPDFVPDPSKLAREVAADVYARRIGAVPVPDFAFTDDDGGRTKGAASIARALIAEPTAEIKVPDEPFLARVRARFAVETRETITERKRRQRILTYDDQLTGLLSALTDEVTGQAARDRLASKFRVVLVDEFQDTDRVQWQILHTAFHGRATLVLIGDPKQAIYGFRGADVHSYVAATDAADGTAGLPENHRTDKALVAAVSELFTGAAVGHHITVPAVTAHLERRIAAADPELVRPFRVRGIDVHKRLHYLDAVDAVTADLTRQVVRLLSSGVALNLGPQPAPLRPRDIAVLVRTNRAGKRITAALRAAGVACLFSGEGSVFASPAARDWVILLETLLDTRPDQAPKAALTSFVQQTFAGLATAPETWHTQHLAMLHSWAIIWQRHGIAALWQTITAREDFAGPLLASPEGTRCLADLRQVAHLLQAAEVDGNRGRTLIEWLGSQISDARDVPRALETDDDAVRVMTIHKSKGLQFPLVLIPEATTSIHVLNPKEPFVYHEGGQRYLDVSGPSANGASERAAAAEAEAAAESLRELYVAVTRAQVGVITWWVQTREVDSSALHRLLCRPADVTEPARTYPATGLRVRPHIAFEPLVTPIPPARFEQVPPTTAEPRVLRLTRAIDRTWRRTSYSGLTALAHEAAPLADGRDHDESAPQTDPLESGAEPDSLPAHAEPAGVTSPMAAFPGGAEFGTLVHSVLEGLDWTAEPLEPVLREVCADRLARTSIPIEPTALAASLLPVLDTPLGPLAAGRTLRRFPAADHLSELAFDLPLGGSPLAAATLGGIADLCATHLSPTDPLVGYPALLRQLDPGAVPLRGMLTGSIDSVLRLSPENRFLVVDYKTNRLGDDAQLVDAYHPAALAGAMQASHYPLQALFYSVALHRFLRWRLGGYDPDQHLAGVLYLFVRGMTGPGAPDSSPTGVFSWRPPTALVTGLSRLLAGSEGGANA